MPRIRTIKPGFFESEDVAALPMRARLTWIGLWTHCDDAGRTKDNPKLIKARIWPLDSVSLADIEDDLETLATHGRIVRYEVDGRRYLAITNWREHQTIQKPSPSPIPPPPHESGSPTVALPDGYHWEGKGRERKGKDARPRATPPQKCPEHANDPNPPNCRDCKNHRLNYEQWKQDREQAQAQLRAELKAARADPDLRCSHGHDGGLHLRSDTGQPLCASCRAEVREAI